MTHNGSLFNNDRTWCTTFFWSWGTEKLQNFIEQVRKGNSWMKFGKLLTFPLPFLPIFSVFTTQFNKSNNISLWKGSCLPWEEITETGRGREGTRNREEPRYLTFPTPLLSFLSFLRFSNNSLVTVWKWKPNMNQITMPKLQFHREVWK